MTTEELKAEIAALPRDTLETMVLFALTVVNNVCDERDRLRFELYVAKERVDIMLDRCPLDTLQ